MKYAGYSAAASSTIRADLTSQTWPKSVSNSTVQTTPSDHTAVNDCSLICADRTIN